ncbi:hypothetical protein [Aeromicrobium sp. HA]|uniref:hypothetical protein n=1 Tax=Aeromicrobium sp. HA TaxID=3009077 RepID=UPI0022AEDFA0|nr:hypothetical protein [Aeromicrobium sp. HA]
MNAADLTAAHVGRQAVIRMGRDRVAGWIATVQHDRSGTSVVIQPNPDTHHVWHDCRLSHDDQIELKEPKP